MEPAIASVSPERAEGAALAPAGAAADAALWAYLGAATSRLRTLRWLRSAELFLRFATGSTLLVALLVALLPGVDARAVAFPVGGAVLLGVAIAVGAGRLGRANRERSREVIHALAAARADLADELASFVELREHARDGRLSGGLAFLILLGERLAQRTLEAPVGALLPAKPALRRVFGSVLLCALALMSTSWLAPRLLPELWLALRSGHPSVPPPPAPPIIGDVELELHPPAYTGLPVRSLPASAGDVRALPGTEVTIRARSLVGAVRRATLRVEPAEGKPSTLPVEVGASGAAPTLTASMRVERAGAYRFVLWRWRGRMAEPGAHRIELEVDQPPRVELTAPGDPLELEVPRPIELAYAIEDDFSVGDVALAWRVGDGPEQRKALDPERPTPRRARGRFVWELGELERNGPLPAGTRIEYWLEARDNDTVSGPKRARSSSFSIVLHEKPAPAARDRQQLEALLEESITALADRLERPGAQSEAQRHAALVMLAQHFGSAGSAPERGERGTTLAFRKLAAEIAQRLSDRAAEEQRDTRAAQAPIIAELERDVLALDDLRGRRRLEEMTRVGAEMKQVRDALQRLFTELKGATSEGHKAELRREIERKLTELEAKMAELRQLAAQGEGEVPDQFLNRESIDKQPLQSGVDQIRKALEQGDLERAASRLADMSRSLDKLAGSLDRSMQEFGGERRPEEEKAMEQTESELFDLAKEEREIERAGRAIEQRGAGKRDLSALRKQLGTKLDELARRAAEHERETSFSGEHEELERLRTRAQQIGQALDADNLDGAQEMAEDARRVTSGLSAELRGAMSEAEAEAQARVGDGPSTSLRHDTRHIGETDALAREIEETLERAGGDGRPQLGEADRKQLEDLERRQAAAEQHRDALAKQLGDKASPGMAGLPEGVRGDVDGAGQNMRESQRQLGRPAPGRGAEAAGQAAERLEAARKQVSDQRNGGSSGEDAPSGARDELVKIPGADDSAAPRAFREELMDAMKRGAPRHFEEQVKQYYEELVR